MANTPVGRLLLVANADALVKIVFLDATPSEQKDDTDNAETHPVLVQAVNELNAYFAGQRLEFDVAVNLTGTPFQQQVWQALQQIPYGDIASYGDIARLVGNPKAARAVGMANNRNPVPIIVPCHRVIGKNGDLTGYAGGVEIKQQLLHLEKITSAKAPN
jgi:methylated-DNA-[protein]-cysteine S-methyltransferase